jgi:hypothetical protein
MAATRSVHCWICWPQTIKPEFGPIAAVATMQHDRKNDAGTAKRVDWHRLDQPEQVDEDRRRSGR